MFTKWGWLLCYHLGLSGRLKIEAITIVPNTTGNANGSLQDADESIYEQPNSSHKATMRPRAQKIPKLETCSPRLFALAVSACQTLTVAMMPPVPSPRTMREMMNCENWKEVAIRMQPMLCMRHESQIVFRRPNQSPIQVQARAPKTPSNVYNATMVPRSCQSLERRRLPE